MRWQEEGAQLWRRVERSAAGGRPRIPAELVFDRLVVFLRAGCALDVFDELCRDSDVSGRTCRRRFAEWRDLGFFEIVSRRGKECKMTSANPNESTITHSLLEDVEELPATTMCPELKSWYGYALS